MDELIHHCLRELSFDGDLGSNVSRLKDFIVDFYAHANASHAQTPDDAFCAFVWSLVVQQSTVLVGLIEPSITSEVWVAPQTSAKRKAKARGEDHVEPSPPKLEPIPEPKNTPLDTLLNTYGDRLRLAVEPDAIFAAITGSHIRSSKMSAMVYSALQIITRGRDAGVTVVELGKRSGYDQKTCFYLVKQLTELDLVLKVRRGGVGTHFCIHKYFFERSSSWKAIRDEEHQAEDLQTRNQRPEIDIPDEDEDIEDRNILNFTPIDARHLSSLPLISGRVIRLLKASRNHIHASNNMLITLGFSNPTKTDRRFFQSRIREMIQQRLIEKIAVPSNRNKSASVSVKCFRLVTPVPSTPADSGAVASDVDDDGDDAILAQSGVNLNTTIHKQIIDLLEESGTSGMTLNELSVSLCQFDKRTIELLLARADKSHPPSHLSDLRIASIMETSGRERHHRHFTAANFRKLVDAERLDQGSTGFDEVDLDNAGGSFPLSDDLFYTTEQELAKYCDGFKVNDTSRLTKSKQRSRRNPVVSDNPVKLGRPRKNGISKDNEKSAKVATSSPSLKRKRKSSLESPPTHFIGEEEEPAKKRVRLTKESIEEPITPKRKRGRPPKLKDKPECEPESLQSSKSTSVTITRTRSKRLIPVNPASSQVYNPPQEESNNHHRIPPHIDHINGSDVVEATMTAAVDMELMHAPTTIFASSGHINETAAISPQKEHTSRDAHIHVLQYGSSEMIAPSTDVQSFPDADGETFDGVNAAPNLELESMQISDQRGVVDSSPSRAEVITIPNETHISTSPSRQDSSMPSRPSMSNGPSRVNVSHLRRENELLQLVGKVGGILNIQTKEFYEGHMEILETLARAGEPTSSPVGTKIDKRTAAATFSSLEKQGRIKQLRTSITTPTGINKVACIVYLPGTDQTKLNSFLTELAQVSPTPASHFTTFVKIDQRVDYGADPASTSRGALPLQLLQMEQPGGSEKERWSRNVSRANQLFTYDDTTIREVFLAERTTLAQLYGFLVGRALRCRQLHLSAIQALESQYPSPHIVSHDKRIIDLTFFCQDLTLEVYCSLVSPLGYNQELSNLFQTEEGRKTLVRDLPQNIQTSLQVGRSRARSRILDILEMLRSLGLIVPLQPSTSTSSFITCSPSDQYPAFDLAPLEGWTANTPTIAPSYWYFNESALIHVWAVSETRPPFWKNVAVTSYTDSLAYWDDLREACNNQNIVIESEQSNPTYPSCASVAVARSIRRAASWKEDYFLTWHQIQYLKQFLDVSSISTPLQIPDDQERQSQLDKLCWVTGASQDTIEKYFTSARDKLLKSLERMKLKAEKSQKTADETKLSLAKKAKEARLQREKDWSELLLKHHPEAMSDPELVRVERVRMQFLQSASIKDVSRWEQEIQAALHEANLASSKVLKISNRRSLPSKALPSHSISAPVVVTETSVQELIDLQGPPTKYAKVIVKRKHKKDKDKDLVSEEPKKPSRRHRFQWSASFDELARDASAIIRARCRNLARLDWAAFEQVFPSVPRNTVRQRLSHIKETPGNETYLRRLEDTWYDLWMSHKGSPELPDDDVISPSNFDLVKHIEFLRRHIDKDALRVGLAQTTEIASFVLPDDLEHLQGYFEVVEEERIAPEWDFMWNAHIEGREKRLKRHVLSRCPETFPPSRPCDNDEVSVAEGVLKMAMGTPPELYDPEQASSLLKTKGDEVIDIAIKNMLSRGVLSKSQRDPQKQKPGRQLKISEGNQNAIGGNIVRDTFQDAISLLEAIDIHDDTWHEWPLTATDGDCATLIELVSDDKVDFDIDTTLPQAARQALDWNSKKTDDDQLETAISVRYRLDADIRDTSSENIQFIPATVTQSMDAVEPEEFLSMESGHGLNSSNNAACCRKMTARGLVDCASCLSDARSDLLASLDPSNREAAEWILQTVHDGGEAGVRKSDVHSLLDSHESRIASIVSQMTDADIPLVYWAGYDTLVLTSAHYISKWAVTVCKDPIINVFPRRWLDIRGVRVADFWQAALRAVVSLVVFRPGISQTEIRWRLRSVYDRQEVNEILHYLQVEGYLQLRLGVYAPFDDDAESQAFWFIGEKHWYHV